MKKLLLQPVFLAVAILVIILFGVAGYHYDVGYPAWVMMATGILIGSVLVIALKLLLTWLLPFIKKIPLPLLTSLLGGFISFYLLREFAFRWPSQLFYALVVFGFVCTALFVFGIWNIFQNKRKPLGIVLAAGGVLFVVFGFYAFNGLDGDPYTADVSQLKNLDVTTIADMGIQDPSNKGNFEVEVFTYGSGTDKKRPEYAMDVKLKTPTVDASRLLPEWKGKKKKWREKYWGFGVDSFP